MPHPVWSEEELHSVQITHTPPEKPVDTVTADSTRTVLKLMHSPELWKQLYFSWLCKYLSDQPLATDLSSPDSKNRETFFATIDASLYPNL